MSETVIRVENLGKKYVIGHQKQERYTALRDVLAEKARSFGQMFSRNGKQDDPTHEEFWALKDVSFEIKQGDRVGIIGRNGAGKSTLLKILSRITEPTEGRISIKGRVASLLEVGTGFHPELTGRENIFLNGAILGMGKVEIARKFDEIVAFAEVEKFLDTPVKRYSSGMYVRLAFAVAAHLETDILILDEVLAVGDSKFQKKCLGKMKNVSQNGKTVIFVSHQLDLARSICTSGILMKSGKIDSINSIESVIGTYLDNSKDDARAIDEQLKGSKYIDLVEVRSSDSLTHGRVFFGEPLSVYIKLKDLPDFPVGVNLNINNNTGKLVSLFSTNPHDGFEIPSQRIVQIKFNIDFCCYAPGEYYLSVAVSMPAIKIIEEIHNVCIFEVLPKRIGGYWLYESRFGDFFPKHSWELENTR